MKRTLSFLLIFCSSTLFASTSIITPTVSGHWTLAGSPYLILNNITISAYTVLTIDSGVEVVFQGSYKLNVQGTIQALGTRTAPINFHVQDTTGFSTIDTSGAGGWLGINAPTYIPDSSAFRFCNVFDVKFGTGGGGVLGVGRPMEIRGCNFYHNRLNAGIVLQSYTNTFPEEIDSCSFYNNYQAVAIVQIQDYFGGSTFFHDNTLYQNEGTAVYGVGTDLLCLHNEIYQNTGVGIEIVGNHVTLKNNKVHDNTNTSNAAINCNGGFVDINSNLICNNQHTAGSCGAAEGGGGLCISSNSSVPYDSTFYTVRNNIIANNYSPFEGGAIKIYYTPAIIANNQIINNTAAGSGGGAIFLFESQLLTIKNNIFYGNVTVPYTSLNSPNIIGLSSGAFFNYANNWSEKYTYNDIVPGGTFTVINDTTTNMTGTNPGLIYPTLTANVTESALTANFGITSSSPCINSGDTTGASPYTTDYAGNARLFGPRIDIGAYEAIYYNVAVKPIIQSEDIQIEVYPNPASNLIFIRTSNTIGTLSISDITGKTISQKSITDNLTFFDIHTYTPGIYFIKWNDRRGSENVKKLVVE